MKGSTDLCVAHVVTFVETDATGPTAVIAAAADIAADAHIIRCIQRIQVVRVVAAAAAVGATCSPVPQCWSSYGSST